MQAAIRFFISASAKQVSLFKSCILFALSLVLANSATAGDLVYHGIFISVDEARAGCVHHLWGDGPYPQYEVVSNLCGQGTGGALQITGVYALQDDETGFYIATGNGPAPDRTVHLWAYYGSFCEEPAVPNPNSTSALNACMVICPAARLFDAQIRYCAPEVAAAESEECEVCNPINFSTGDKYLIETDYSGAGAFPLTIQRYYHSHQGRDYNGRTEWTLKPQDPQPRVVHYEPVVPFGLQRRFTPFTKVEDPILSQVLPDPVKYRSNVSTKWGHTYDRYLFASFGYMTQNYSENPAVVRLYRPDGTVEHYRYNGGAYTPANGHTSQITRLPAGHALAPGWQVINEANEIEIYDMDGKPVRITNSSGLSHHLTYDTATHSRLVKVEDDFGQKLEFEYGNPSNPLYPDRPTLIRDPEGNEYRYTYTGNGLITRVTYPDQTPGNPADNPFKTYHYEKAGFPDALTGITDENGERYATYGYDAAGRGIFTEHAGGAQRADIAYDTVNLTRTITNALGRQTVYTLNNSGMVLNVAGSASPSGLVDAANRTNVYSSAGFITRTTDWRGNITNYTRDARGLETSRTEAFGTAAQRTINTTWHATLRLPTAVIEPGRTTSMTYDSLGHLLTLTETDTTTRTVPYSTNGQSRTTTFTYYPPGTNGALQLATVDGPRTDVNDLTTYTYNAAGLLTRVTNALGHETEITAYNARGLPLSVVDENDVITTFSYHPRGWLLSSTVKHPSQSSLDAVTSYLYDAAGQVTRITLPNGSFLAYDYDAAHRLTSVANNLGESITYTLDAAGNVMHEETRNASAQIKQVQTRVFDELSRLYQNIGGANQVSRFDYDKNGNLLETRADPSGLNQVTTQAFDSLNRLVAATDAMNGLSDYGYDRRDNLVSVQDERGLVTGYIYDGFDNLLMLDSPDTGITIYTYDKAGNVTKEVDARGIEKQFTYDALNRVTLEHYPASSDEDVVYGYDQAAGVFGIGRLTSLDDQSGTTAYVYDHRGNQVATNTTIEGNSYTTQFQYDLADNLTRTVYPSGRVVEQQLDTLGRVSAVTTRTTQSAAPVPVVGNLAYLPFGPAESMEYGNDVTVELSYDQDYRLTAIEMTGGGSGPDILGLNYSLNNVNNIDSIVSADTSRSQVFEYDLLNRLTDASGIYGILLYDYDAVGNRLAQHRVEGTTQTTEAYTYFQDSNSISSREEDGEFRFYQYDANGNVRSDGNQLYFYNRQNRLIQVAE